LTVARFIKSLSQAFLITIFKKFLNILSDRLPNFDGEGTGVASGTSYRDYLFFPLPGGLAMVSHNRSLRCWLHVEPLEDRFLPSTGIIPPVNPPVFNSSTVPANGDINPYGVAFVPQGFEAGGPLKPGDLLVSNFNASSNLQGTGTTIMRFSPKGNPTLFFQGPSGLGLTTALGVLQAGFVLVGNVPTTDGTFNTIQQGSLMILDHNGFQVANLSNAATLDGPWDLTINDQGKTAQVFVSDVLSGTVTRLDLQITDHNTEVNVTSVTQIASGYLHRGDPAALAIGPTGLAYDAQKDILYVASTGDNEIFAIHNAKDRTHDGGMGDLVYQDTTHLHGPLGLALAPNGDLLTTNGDAINPDTTQPSEMVEFTTKGKFVSQFSVDSSGIGGAFGLAVTLNKAGNIRLAAVDDITNSLIDWTIDFDQSSRDAAITLVNEQGGSVHHQVSQSSSLAEHLSQDLLTNDAHQSGVFVGGH
jgi:hypothetical protein